MTTFIKTLKTNTRYPVEGVAAGCLIVRQPSGKKRVLALKDVGRARYDAAVAHYYAQRKGANA